MIAHRFLKGVTETVGPFERHGVTGVIVEPMRTIPLDKPIAAHLAGAEIDEEYRAGPTFAMLVPDGYVDAETGFAFDSQRRFIRESAMVQKYADRAEQLYPSYDFDSAYSIRSSTLSVISNQRGGNYCRWWLDSISKFYVFETFAQSIPGLTSGAFIEAPIEKSYQSASLELMGYPPGLASAPGRLLRGDLLISTGLTYGGGQNISPLVRECGAFILEKSGLAHLHKSPAGRNVYVTRRLASMRRILNEDELWPGLQKRGYDIVALEELSLEQQIETFASARTIVSPHGAGLTNIMFCQAGALLVEIFPDIGVHSSAFRRMATNMKMSYAIYAGPNEPTSNRVATNPRNVNLRVEIDHFFNYLDELPPVRTVNEQ